MQIAHAARQISPAAEPPSLPWWRYGIVWFAFAGPALVVVAGIATLVIAFRNADTVLSEPPAPKPVGALVNGALLRPESQPTAPALIARNHAATPPQAPERR